MPREPEISSLLGTKAEAVLELWRYYKIGVVNTIFGYGVYSGLVFIGFNIYAAQFSSTFIGLFFNYYMFKFHVFHGKKPHLIPYVLVYAGNYLVGVGCLTLSHHFLRSPYVAGLCALLMLSILRFFVLKKYVFRQRI
jgi:putative flippase GtrA